MLTGDLAPILTILHPDVLIDARMRKRATPEPQRGLAPLTIGLGPNFVAEETVDVVIETSWDAPGEIITEGRARALAGEPRPISGHGRERYVYAPTEGVFRTRAQIGQTVTAGEEVAWLGEGIIRAPLTGRMRGLVRDGVPVTAGMKVLEVDPRGRPPW